MRVSRKVIALGAIVSLGLVATACGDDDSTKELDAAAEEATAPAAQTIAEIAAGNPDFSILVELLTAAGLVETLAGEGPFTVFAPTNAAFEILAAAIDTDIEGFKAQTLADVDFLKKTLLTHVYAGKVMAADTAALDGQEVEMVSGEKATVSSKDGAVSLTIGASVVTVVTADVEASNGVIHIIDQPLLPLEAQS